MDADTKEKLLDILNKKGFLLEERLRGVLPKKHSNFNLVVDDFKGLFDSRIEIDAILDQEGTRYIFECKQTQYSWLFPYNHKTPKDIYFVYMPRGSLKKCDSVRSFFSKLDLPIVNDSISIRLDSKQKPMIQKGLPLLSYKDARDGVSQILKEVNAYLNYHDDFEKLVPVLVTNTELYTCNYSDENISDGGFLADIELVPQNMVVYNFPMVLRDSSGAKVTSSHGDMTSVVIVKIGQILTLLDSPIGIDTSLQRA
jgi:hypothetical protein